jgi:hypothetical protein
MVARNSPGLIMREQQATVSRAPSDCDTRFVSKADVRRYWLEWIISRQLVTGSGHYIAEFAAGPSGGFYANELGFGWRNAELDVLQTRRTLRADNAARKEQLRKDHEKQQRRLKEDAELLGKRPVLEPWREAEGCTGCDSCVAGARRAPSVIKLAGRFADWRQWTPNSLPLEQQAVIALLTTAAATLRRAIREEQAVTSFLRTAAAAIRRARREERSAAYKARKEQHSYARAQQKARREEANGIESAARRAYNGGTTRRRQRVEA